MIKKILLLISCFSLISCTEKGIEKSISFYEKDTVVKIKELKQVENQSIIYGKIIINNNEPKVSKVDLDCISIELEGVGSKKIYADSIASVLVNQYSLNADVEKPSIDVYWVMNNKLTSSIDNVIVNVEQTCK